MPAIAWAGDCRNRHPTAPRQRNPPPVNFARHSKSSSERAEIVTNVTKLAYDPHSYVIPHAATAGGAHGVQDAR